ncbi:MAG: 2-oxoacid:ferredoxin oxidoreductase subunit beta, partial [Pseudomonadota bacterium]
SKAVHADYIPPSQEIQAAYEEGAMMPVELHDGGYIQLRKLEKDYDPTDRGAAFSRIMASQNEDEILTGLLYLDETQPDLHETQNMEARPLNEIPYPELNPGADRLRALQAEFR